MIATDSQVENVYVGAYPFESGQPFYGRDWEITELRNLLVARRIVLLYSPSGAGKTSLIQAGLMPLLEDEGLQARLIPNISQSPPGDVYKAPEFNRYVYGALVALNDELPMEQRTPAEQLLRLDLPTYLSLHPGNSKPEILIVDQFEDVLTVDPTDQKAKHDFFAQLGSILTDRDRWALFAMREEYTAALEDYLQPIPTRFRTTFRLGLLSTEAALMAIQKPAQDAGVKFSDKAANDLVYQLSLVRVLEPDGSLDEKPAPVVEPTLLQIVCFDLWEKRRLQNSNGPEIVIEEDKTSLYIEAALAEHYAKEVKKAAGGNTQRERIIRTWIDENLITPQGFRRQVLKTDVDSKQVDGDTLSQLIAGRLLREKEGRGLIWIELAHDQLVEPIRNNNSFWLSQLSTLQRQATVWDKSHRAPDLLLHGKLLREAEEWSKANEDQLSQTDKDFLADSLAARKQYHQRLVLSLAVLMIVLSLTVAAIFFAGVSVIARQNTTNEHHVSEIVHSTNDTILAMAKNADAEATLRQALTTTTILSDTPMVWPFDTFSRLQQFTQFWPRGWDQPTISAQVTNTVRDALRQAPLAIFRQKNTAWFVEFSPNGRFLGTAGADGLVHLISLMTGDVLTPVQHTEPVVALAFSPDSFFLATAGADGKAYLVDTSGLLTSVVITHEVAVLGLTFDPNSNYLATYGADGRVYVVDIKTKKVRLAFTHTGRVTSVAFNPQGTLLASAGWDGNVQLLDLTSERPPTILPTNVSKEFGGNDDSLDQSAVNQVLFSPDGSELITISNNHNAWLWPIPMQTSPRSIAHDDWIVLASVSQDGSWLATASTDHVVKLNNRTRPNLSEPIEYTLPFQVRMLLFSPDNSWLANVGLLNEVYFYNLKTGEDHIVPTPGLIRSAAFSPNGAWFAVASDVGTAYLFRLCASQRECATNPVIDRVTAIHHQGAVTALAFNPDSSKLATIGEDSTVHLVETSTGNELAIRSHTQPLRAVVFHPSGALLATASDDRTTRLWKASSETGPASYESIAHSLDMAFDGDGSRLRIAQEDGTIQVVDIATGAVTRLTGEVGKQTVRAAFSPDASLLVSVDTSNTVLLRETGNGTSLMSGSSGSAQATKFIFNQNNSRLAFSDNLGDVHLWEIQESQPFSRTYLHTNDEVKDNYIYSINFDPTGNLLATANINGVGYLVDATTGITLAEFLHSDAILAVAFDQNGRHVVTASKDHTAVILDTLTPTATTTTLSHPRPIVDVLFNPAKKQIVTVAEVEQEEDNGQKISLYIWESNDDIANLYTNTLTISHILSPKNWGAINVKVKYSPTGDRLAVTYSDGSWSLWDVAQADLTAVIICDYPESITEPSRINGSGGCASTDLVSETTLLDFSKDGQRLLVATGKSQGAWYAFLINSEDGKVIASKDNELDRCWTYGREKSEKYDQLDGCWKHNRPIQISQFSPSGLLAVTGSADGVIQVRNASTGELLAYLEDDAGFKKLVFDKADNYLATLTLRGNVHLWSLRLETLVKAACSVVADSEPCRKLDQTSTDNFSIWTRAYFAPSYPATAARTIDRTEQLTHTPSITDNTGITISVFLFDDYPGDPQHRICNGFSTDCKYAACKEGERLLYGPWCLDSPDIGAGEYLITLYGLGRVIAGATDFGISGQRFRFGSREMILPDSFTFCWPGLQPGGTGFETVVEGLGVYAAVTRVTVEYLGPKCSVNNQ